MPLRLHESKSATRQPKHEPHEGKAAQRDEERRARIGRRRVHRRERWRAGVRLKKVASAGSVTVLSLRARDVTCAARPARLCRLSGRGRDRGALFARIIKPLALALLCSALRIKFGLTAPPIQ